MTMLALIGWGCMSSILISMYGQYLWRMQAQDMLLTDEIHLLCQFTNYDIETIYRYKGLR